MGMAMSSAVISIFYTEKTENNPSVLRWILADYVKKTIKMREITVKFGYKFRAFSLHLRAFVL